MRLAAAALCGFLLSAPRYRLPRPARAAAHPGVRGMAGRGAPGALDPASVLPASRPALCCQQAARTLRRLGARICSRVRGLPPPPLHAARAQAPAP